VSGQASFRLPGDNNSYELFRRLGDLIVTGLTGPMSWICIFLIG
jgi:glycerate-2-kinase